MENIQDKNLNNLNNEEIVEELTSNETDKSQAIANTLENQGDNKKTLSVKDIFNSDIGDDGDLVFGLTKDARISEGIHQFVLRGVHREYNQKTAYGLKDQVLFDYDVTDENGCVISITDRNNISESSKSRFKNNLRSYCEALGATKINLKKLINIKGTLKIVHNTDDDGNIFENIAEIYPTNEFDNGIGGATEEIDV
ncbi:hypothetical protein GND98_016520 [Clostridium butyricum]|uniref:Uncharacterized protein n=1 Tax=Clostridium butyricum TaxID=1492 RepID=A0A6L9ES76_CLOBU|nr:hypothetical protein [Clostridium butyricum]NAS19413.1 hypothetical protein [Clostridium butyricum]RQN09157.1 hypothetical protein EHW71_12950 [Clostridium butyricum]